jgi:hypothetical protein
MLVNAGRLVILEMVLEMRLVVIVTGETRSTGASFDMATGSRRNKRRQRAGGNETIGISVFREKNGPFGTGLKQRKRNDEIKLVFARALQLPLHGQPREKCPGSQRGCGRADAEVPRFG